jgi:hypothetical protein
MGSNQSNLSLEVVNKTLNKDVTNIITDNTTNAKNILTLDNTVTIQNSGTYNCPQGGTITQKNAGTMKVVTKVSNQATDNLKSFLTTSITTKAGISNKLIQGFLSGIGQVNNNNLDMSIRSQIKNIIEKNITTNNLNNILNQLSALNKSTIQNTGYIAGVGCDILQENTASLQAENIISSLYNSIISDSTLNQITTDATVSNSVTQKGLDDLISSLTGPLAIIVIGVLIALAVTGKEGIKSVTDWRFIAAAGGVSTVILGGLYAAKAGPFKPSPPATPQSYWACGTDSSGINSDPPRCVQLTDKQKTDYDNSFKPYWNSEADCNDAISKGNACKTYYRCEMDSKNNYYDGNIIKCNDIVESPPKGETIGTVCPYKTSDEALKECGTFTYRCDQITDDSGNEKPKCTRINSSDALPIDHIYNGISDSQAKESCNSACTALASSTNNQ